jgi:hypothetical protein
MLADNERILAREDMIQALSDREPVSNVITNAILLKLESIQDQIGRSSGRFATSVDERMDVHVVGDYHDIVDEKMELNANTVNQAPTNETYTARSLRLQQQKETRRLLTRLDG